VTVGKDWPKELDLPSQIQLAFARGDARRLAAFLHEAETFDLCIRRRLTNLLKGGERRWLLELHYRLRHRPSPPLAAMRTKCLDALNRGSRKDRLMIADLLDPAPGAKHHTHFQLKFTKQRAGHPSTALRDTLRTLCRDAIISQERGKVGGKLDAVIKTYEGQKGFGERSIYAVRAKARKLSNAKSRGFKNKTI
jgi:hypothetical protein